MTIESSDIAINQGASDLQSNLANPKGLLINIQALRGLAAMLVVFSHLFIIERKYSPDQLLGGWTEYGAVGVDLFFVISGFIMVYITQPKGAVRDIAAPSKIKQTGAFWLARILRIYPLYWCISLAVLALYIVRPDMVFSSAAQPPNIVKSFALLPESRPPLLAVGWTLIHEMYFYLVFGLFLLFARKWLIWLLAGWAVLTLCASFAGLRELGPGFALVFSPMTLQFCAGALAAWLLLRESQYLLTRNGALICIAAGAALIAFAVLALSLKAEITPAQFLSRHGLRTAVFIAPAFLIISGMARLDWLKIQAHGALKALGDWSYAIYLTHVLTLTLMGRIWALFAGPDIGDNIVMLPLMMAGSIVVGWLTFIIIERPLLRLAKTLRRKQA